MPMWRCPHCGTPQAETARCWVCHRSSTACATCRHFRRSVAAQLGYCGLDRQRRPLRGDEIRACWDAATATAEAPTASGPRPTSGPTALAPERTPVRRLEFVEVGAGPPRARGRAAAQRRDGSVAAATAGIEAAVSAPDTSPPPVDPSEPGWSLWGDGEP